ncbi:MAG: indolepyruvate oxidoreductase subunit beta [Bacteroidales bacterium]
MQTDIIIAGVGGQGILSIAACIGMVAIEDDLHFKQSEVHGMSQRGGAVQSNLRISDREIDSDLIPLGKADMIISVEPMESLRYLPWLSEDGWLITNTTPVKNINDYPDEDKIIKEIEKIRNHVIIDADKIARETGSSRASNIVILGAASQFLKIDQDKLESAIAEVFKRKGNRIVELNLQAFRSGREFTNTKS